MSRRHRSHAHHIADKVVAVSVSYERDNLLSRGFGIEHLREMLLRLLRPLIRQSASVAFGGNWVRNPDNFTFNILDLISAEQEDTSNSAALDAEVSGSEKSIGCLINHVSWPDYLEITPRIEAEWIRCCRIVRVTQQMADISADSIIRDDVPEDPDTDRQQFNRAVTLTTMRRKVCTGMNLEIPGMEVSEKVPASSARIVLGGKVSGFSGFMPGILEEALLTMEHDIPLYLLGGFGGAAEVLANALLARDDFTFPQELTVDWHRERDGDLERLIGLAKNYEIPDGIRPTAEAFEELRRRIRLARKDIAGTLNTGLDEEETREMLTTSDMTRAVRLVHQGLTNKIDLQLGQREVAPS